MARHKPLTEIVHIVQSGHWNMTVAQLLSALDYFFQDENADIVQYTEVSPPKFYEPLKRYCEENRLHLHHPRRRGARECMTISRLPVNRLRSYATQVTKLGLKVGRKYPTFLLTTKVRGWGKFRILHTPAHTGGLKRTGTFAWPTKVYYSVVGGVRRVLDGSRGKETLCGDVNLDVQLAKNATLLGRIFKGLKPAWDDQTKPDLGKRLITGLWTNLEVIKPMRRLNRQPGHDHAPEMTVLGQPHRA